MFDFSRHINTVNTLYSITDLPMSILDTNLKTLYCRPKTEGHILPDKIIEVELENMADKNLPSHMPYIKSDSFSYFIGIIELEDSHYLTVGPATAVSFELNEFIKLFENTLTREEILHLYRVCENSAFTNAMRFANVMSTLVEMIFHEQISATAMLSANSLMEVDISDENISMDSTAHYMDEIINLEGMIYSAISGANPHELDQIWNGLTSMVSNMMSNTRHAEQYIIIPLLTIMSRAAVYQGADLGAVFSLYNDYITRIDQEASAATILTHIMDASYRFCDLVGIAKGKSRRSPLCQDCEKYISNHLRDRLTVKDIAEACGVTERQIYRVFEKYFHMTVTEYINNEKMRHAALILSSTHLTISEISSYLGYVSQSYFTKKFIEHYGVKPSEYRGLPG